MYKCAIPLLNPLPRLAADFFARSFRNTSDVWIGSLNHSAIRHAGNYAALLGLLFVTAYGADQLAIWLGWRPLVGCLVLPAAVLNQVVAVWIVSIGTLLAIIGWNRSLGLKLILVGVVFSQLPGLLAAFLGPFCTYQ